MSEKIKKELFLQGLGCPDCAFKMENEISHIEGVESASINFVTKRLTILGEQAQMDEILNKSVQVIKRIESYVEVLETEEAVDKIPDKNIWHKVKGNITLWLALIFFGTAIIFKFPQPIEAALYIISFLLAGGLVLLRAAKNIFRGQVFDENFLMSVATIGAFAIGEFPEGAAVMIFYQIGEYFQDAAVDRSRRSITELMNLKSEFANLVVEGQIEKVSPETVKVGESIIVKPGEKVPLDGRIEEGFSSVDTSSLTGESVPRDVGIGDSVLSGFINKGGLLTVEVTKPFSESTVSKILDLVQNASSKKAPTENFITKFARYYTPAVVLTALALALIPPLTIEGAVFSQWIYRALIFLVISCPCALVVSIPLGFFGGIGGASRAGILIKGSNYLEALNSVDTIVFDKTGTLTKGIFKVSHVSPKGEFSEEELLELAAAAESYSNHPIAVSILSKYGKEINKAEIVDYKEISGYGIAATIKGRVIFAGNEKLMVKESIAFGEETVAGTKVYIAVDGKYAGYILISDELKEDSEAAVIGLKELGIQKIVMLTGDNRTIGEKTAAQLGISEAYSELLPAEKVQKVELLLEQSKGKLLFVGDGINDAPVLTRADIGAAMGGLGSDAAIEAADIVIMNDEPSKIVSALKIARKTKNIVWQNIVFAFGVKFIVLLLGAGGLATMWEAVFADVGVALIAVINAMRVLNTKNL